MGDPQFSCDSFVYEISAISLLDGDGDRWDSFTNNVITHISDQHPVVSYDAWLDGNCLVNFLI